jgi:hypothetical protein
VDERKPLSSGCMGMATGVAAGGGAWGAAALALVSSSVVAAGAGAGGAAAVAAAAAAADGAARASSSSQWMSPPCGGQRCNKRWTSGLPNKQGWSQLSESCNVRCVLHHLVSDMSSYDVASNASHAINTQLEPCVVEVQGGLRRGEQCLPASHAIDAHLGPSFRVLHDFL